MNNATAKQFPVPASIRLFSLVFVNSGIFDVDEVREGLLFRMKIWYIYIFNFSVKCPASSHDALSCCRTDNATLCRFVYVLSLKIKSIRQFLSLKCFDLVGLTALALVALVAWGGCFTVIEECFLLRKPDSNSALPHVWSLGIHFSPTHVQSRAVSEERRDEFERCERRITSDNVGRNSGGNSRPRLFPFWCNAL